MSSAVLSIFCTIYNRDRRAHNGGAAVATGVAKFKHVRLLGEAGCVKRHGVSLLKAEADDGDGSQ